jgi:hypothetical protein
LFRLQQCLSEAASFLVDSVAGARFMAAIVSSQNTHTEYIQNTSTAFQEGKTSFGGMVGIFAGYAFNLLW